MLGNNLLVTAGDGSVYGCKSCVINTDCDTIETSNPNSGRAKTYIAGRTDWSINISYLVSDTKIKTDALKVGSSVSILVTVRGATAAAQQLRGTAIVTKWAATSTRGNLVQGSFALRGTGALA